MKTILCVTAALALAGCAATGGNESTQAPAPEKEYRTGSRIPVKNPSATSASPAGRMDPSALGPGQPVRTN